MKKIFLIASILFCYINSNSQVYINEIFATNASTNLDTKYYNYSGWVELFNNGLLDVDLGTYYFSDDKNNKTKWKLPFNILKSKQFAIFWFNEMNNANYTNFKLDAKGAKLFLSKSDGSTIDSLTYPKQYPNISYSRFPDGALVWQYNMEPTIKASNSDKVYPTFTSNPKFSQIGGYYSTPFNLSISTINSNAKIRFTIDGSEPNQNSNQYTSEIPIDKTTIIRAKVFEPGFLPSEITTQSYIFPDHQIHLPSYSLTTDSANLWDNMMGMYVDGTNGVTDFCSSGPKNYNQDWERPFNLEFFDSLGIQQLNQYTGIKIAGHCSRGFPQKSFSIIPRALYGKSKLKYAFFKDKNISSFDRIFLRNSGNDWGLAFMRDGLFNALVKNKIDIDYNAYQPSVVYLNGNYWGLLDTREKLDERYIMSNYNLADTQFDMLENDKSVIIGNSSNYTSLINFVSSNDLTKSANYENVKSKMDMNEYINYMVTEIYIGNTDWPGNNIKYWCPNSGNGKWRWILADLDFGFGVYDPNINHNTLQFALETSGPAWPNPPWSTLLFRKLIVNPEFKREFASRFANYLNTIFEPNTVNHVIDSLQNNISYEIYYHNIKWQGISDWNGNIQFLRTFANLRPDYVRQHIINTLGLSGTFNLSLKSNLPDAGKTFIDNMPVNGSSFKGTYFKEYTVNIKPIANPGYKFLGWYKQTYSVDTIDLISKGDVWKYSDYGYIPSSDWYLSTYDDNAWKTGNAQFGYGDGDETTIINYGSDPNNKYITTYFRKNINITNASGCNGLKLRLLVDDGAIIYLNGTEILRYRMPLGVVDYTTLANYTAGGTEETTYYEFELPASELREGSNTVAVEIHQSSAASSDISFDLKLKSMQIKDLKEELIPGQNIDISSSNNIEILAKYQNLGNLPAIYINEYVTDNQNGSKDENGDYTPWIELFNSTNSSVDIAGMYISNDKNNLTLWQIPASDAIKTTLSSLGFMLLWADGQTNEGILHLPFELNKTGGQLFLTNSMGTDTTILDSLTYQAQMNDVAHGRYTDGTAGIYILANPTPLAPNAEPNKLPIFTSIPVLTANEQAPYTYTITASDFENDNVNYGFINLPSWLSLTDYYNGTGSLTGTPQYENRGDNQVSITASDGKSTLYTNQLFTIQVQGPLVIDQQSIGKFKVYPNPVKDHVTINPDKNTKTYSIRITNLLGKVVSEKNNISGNFRLDLSSYANGVYFLITYINQNTFITKLIKTDN